MTQYWNLNTGMSTTCLGYWILIDGEIKKSVTLLSGFIALHCCLPPTRQRGTVVVPQCWQVGSNNCTNSDHGYKDAIIIYLFLHHLLWDYSFETFRTFLVYFNTEVIFYHGVIYVMTLTQKWREPDQPWCNVSTWSDLNKTWEILFCWEYDYVVFSYFHLFYHTKEQKYHNSIRSTIQ